MRNQFVAGRARSAKPREGVLRSLLLAAGHGRPVNANSLGQTAEAIVVAEAHRAMKGRLMTSDRLAPRYRLELHTD